LKTELLNYLTGAIRPAIEGEWQRLEDEKNQAVTDKERAEEEQRRLEETRRRLEEELKLVKEALRLERIAKYGPKSEQLSDDQLQLLDLEPGVMAAEIEEEVQRPKLKKTERHHPGRAELPPHLPRREVIINCTSAQRTCPQCGEQKVSIGYDCCEELDVEPAKYFVNVIKREKCACKRCEEMGVSTAPGRAKIIDKSKASNAVIIDTIISKYCNHQPLYRQKETLWREAGIELSVMTRCGWIMRIGGSLTALCRAMREDLLAGDYIQSDETTVGVQSERTRGRNHQGYIWEYSRPGGPVVFDFQMGRERAAPRKFLANFNGVLQSDGYSAYDKIGGPQIIYAGCFSHARRGFVDALKLTPGELLATEIIKIIGQLYAVEKQAREAGLSPKERLSLRQLRSLPVLEELKKKIIAARQDVLPKSALGKACDYALGQWPRLIVYANHGEVEIDNNWCENAIRPVALGRKNWLHIGSEEAGPNIAAIMSVIETCRRLEINVRDYLTDVLPKLADWPAKRIAELTPMTWKKAHAAG
jgi:transposase